MSAFAFRIFLIFAIFSSLSLLLVYRTYSRNTQITRYIITFMYLFVCVDTCRYLFDIASILIAFSGNIQGFLKEIAGMVFINRSFSWDYGFSLMVLLLLCFIIYKVEAGIRPHEKSNIICIDQLVISKPKPSINKITMIINVICSIATALTALLNFLLRLLKVA